MYGDGEAYAWEEINVASYGPGTFEAVAIAEVTMETGEVCDQNAISNSVTWTQMVPEQDY
jgi:hypothetical protein